MHDERGRGAPAAGAIRPEGAGVGTATATATSATAAASAALSGAPDPGVGWPACSEARLAGLLCQWWQQDRPAWTDPSWWEATLRSDVRALLWLPAGPSLSTALARLPRGGRCPVEHLDDVTIGLPVPGQAPGWPCACQVVVAAAWHACAMWVAARTSTALVDAAGPDLVEVTVAGGAHQLHDPAVDELAMALRLTPGAAATRVTSARQLLARPRLAGLVEQAAISDWAARQVCEQLRDLTDAQADRVVDEVADRVHARIGSGRPCTSAHVTRIARAARLRICPIPDKEARVRAWAHRRVIVHQQADGMATLIADLAETDALRIHRRLTAIAAGLHADARTDGQPDPRTRDQLRADILVDLLLPTTSPPTPDTDLDAPAATGTGHASAAPTGTDATPSGHARHPATADDNTSPTPGPRATRPDDDPPPPIRSGHPTAEDPTAPPPRAAAPPRADIQVLVTLDTLLGLTTNPALIPGLGPIPANVARQLAADGRWRLLITDATGTVTATGTHTYIPSAEIARLVRAREPHCRFPGCRQPATRCDLDHTIPWPHGATTPTNLGPLCRRHHQLKTHGGWHLDPTPGPTDTPGHETTPPTWRWTSPTGLTTTDHPEPPIP